MGMREYAIKRMFMLIPTVLGVTVICFMIIHLIPGDPAIAVCGEGASMEQLEEIRRAMGLKEPLPVQYWIWMQRILGGEWGRSMLDGTPVYPLLTRRLEATLQLTVFSLLIGVPIGIVLGIVSALKKGTAIDNLCRFYSLMGYSIPIFWLALMLMLVFSVWLGLLPAMGRGSIEHLILPGVALGTYAMGPISRVTRVCVLDLLGQDFVTVLRAKGLPWNMVLFGHVLKNALIPIVTVIGLQFGGLVGGALVTETVFNYPGMGMLILDHLIKRDYTVLQGALLITSMTFIFVNVVVDFLYAYIDPRVRYERVLE